MNRLFTIDRYSLGQPDFGPSHLVLLADIFSEYVLDKKKNNNNKVKSV